MPTTATKPILHETRIDLAEDLRVELIELLNARLADAIDLQLQAKQAHWNVKGPSFMALHELFDQIAESTDGFVDMIAERVTALGGVADGTVQSVTRSSNLTPYPTDISDGVAHAAAVADALATFGKGVRGAIGESEKLDDADTADLFTEVSREIDKLLWFVEAHLQADR